MKQNLVVFAVLLLALPGNFAEHPGGSYKFEDPVNARKSIRGRPGTVVSTKLTFNDFDVPDLIVVREMEKHTRDWNEISVSRKTPTDSRFSLLKNKLNHDNPFMFVNGSNSTYKFEEENTMVRHNHASFRLLQDAAVFNGWTSAGVSYKPTIRNWIFTARSSGYHDISLFYNECVGNLYLETLWTVSNGKTRLDVHTGYTCHSGICDYLINFKSVAGYTYVLSMKIGDGEQSACENKEQISFGLQDG
eukprot:652050_1